VESPGRQLSAFVSVCGVVCQQRTQTVKILANNLVLLICGNFSIRSFVMMTIEANSSQFPATRLYYRWFTYSTPIAER
jgi:hypothetical protein